MWKIKPELLDINVELDRKKRSQDREDVYIIRCGVKLGGYTRQPMEYNTQIEIDPRITLASKDYKAPEIDCLHVDDPEYNNISNSKWAPTEFAERMWANLKIKNLLKVSKLSKNERKKWQAEKRAICLALKYHLVTPVTSLLIVQGPPVPPEPSGNPTSYESGGTRGESGPAGPWGQGEQGEMAPRAQPWPPGLPGREEYEERQLRDGERGAPGTRGEEREDGISEERGPRGPPVLQEQRPHGSVVPGGDRGLPGLIGISGLRGENEELPHNTGSRLHTSITTDTINYKSGISHHYQQDDNFLQDCREYNNFHGIICTKDNNNRTSTTINNYNSLPPRHRKQNLIRSVEMKFVTIQFLLVKVMQVLNPWRIDMSTKVFR